MKRAYAGRDEHGTALYAGDVVQVDGNRFWPHVVLYNRVREGWDVAELTAENELTGRRFALTEYPVRRHHLRGPFWLLPVLAAGAFADCAPGDYYPPAATPHELSPEDAALDLFPEQQCSG